MDNSGKYGEILAVGVSLRLRKASRLVTWAYDKVLRPAGLRSTQLSILITLSLTHTAPISALAGQLQELSLEVKSVGRTLKELVAVVATRVESEQRPEAR